MIHFELVLNEPVKRLVVGGDMVLDHAEEIKRRLLELLAGGDRLEVCLQEGGQVDLCALQLLCATHRQAAMSKKKLSLRAKGAGSLLALSAVIGLARPEGCRFDVASGCLFGQEPPAFPAVEG